MSEAKEKKKSSDLILIAVTAIVAIGVLAYVGSAVMDSSGPKTVQKVDIDTSQQNQDPNKVLAKVGEKQITRGEVASFINESVPPHFQQAPIENLIPVALEQLINRSILQQKANAANMDQNPEVLKRIAKLKEEIEQTVFVEEQVNQALTNDMITDAYNEFASSQAPVQQIRARHILLKTEDEAKAVIQKLKSGEDFEALAKEKSTGPTGVNGGDLGYFSKDAMVPAFSEAAFKLKEGAYSQEPVQTEFGWHVIKVEDSRERPVPDLDQVRPQLETQLRQQIYNDLLNKWREELSVDILTSSNSMQQPQPVN